MRAAGDYISAKALMYHLLRQDCVSKRQRRDAQLLLAKISYGKNPPTSLKKLKIRSVELRAIRLIKLAVLAPVQCLLGDNNSKEANVTEEQLLAYHNQARVDRTVHEQERERDNVAGHGSCHRAI